jgi:hypothetical protein
VRLTLRTLLAYLDDTLDPADAKLIGQKVAESDTAQELIARIKQVTRRRRLAAPPPTGPGSRLDPNTVAEYLDNVLSADQTAEVEQIALSSDAHLADIAACHQILTLVLGEPVLIPPSSRQRMYRLVKGREAVPVRRPQVTGEGTAEPEALPDQETDETLRLGLPAYRSRGSWSSQLAVIGGAAAAALLLILAVWQALRTSQQVEPLSRPGQGQTIAENQTPKGTPPGKTEKTEKAAGTEKGTAIGTTKTTRKAPPAKTQKEEKGATEKKGNDATGTKPTTTAKEPGPQKKPPPPEMAVGAPSTKIVQVGKYLPAEAGPSLLVQQETKGAWRILSKKSPDIMTAQPLVSLPGCISDTELNSGLHLKLWGLLAEQVFFPPNTAESRVVLHDNPDLAADLTLQRGRIVLSNPLQKDLIARLRLDNPTNPDLREVWDLKLEGPGTRVLAEVFYVAGPYEPPEDPNRKGPAVYLEIIILQGSIEMTHDKQTWRMDRKGPQGLFNWDSLTGRGHFTKLDGEPPWVKPNPPLPPQIAADPKLRALVEKRREAMLKARDAFVQALAQSENLEVALDKVLTKSPNKEEHVLVVRSYGALDDLPDLVDAMGNEEQAEVRQAAIATVKVWIAQGRDHEAKLLEVLKTKYSAVESQNIVEMLHYYTLQQTRQRDLYDFLIRRLNDRKIVIRELAAMHLYLYGGPVGGKIRYQADGPELQRQEAQRAWERLVEAGQLPPPAGGASKKK